MGLYAEVPGNKNEWFRNKAELVGRDNEIEMPYSDIPDNQNLVCVVDNVFFHAAGVVYSERELDAFSQSDDTRPKEWYIIDTDILKPYCPTWNSYME